MNILHFAHPTFYDGLLSDRGTMSGIAVLPEEQSHSTILPPTPTSLAEANNADDPSQPDPPAPRRTGLNPLNLVALGLLVIAAILAMDGLYVHWERKAEMFEHDRSQFYADGPAALVLHGLNPPDHKTPVNEH